MKVAAVHVEPFDFVQEVEFRLCGSNAFQLLVNVGNAKLQVLRLARHDSELRDVPVSVLARVVIADFSCETGKSIVGMRLFE